MNCKHRTAAELADNTSSLDSKIMTQSCRALALAAFVSSDAVDVLIKWIYTVVHWGVPINPRYYGDVLWMKQPTKMDGFIFSSPNTCEVCSGKLKLSVTHLQCYQVPLKILQIFSPWTKQPTLHDQERVWQVLIQNTMNSCLSICHGIFFLPRAIVKRIIYSF